MSVIEGDGFTLHVAEDYERVEDYLVPTFIEVTIGGHDGQPTTFARTEIRDGAPACVELRVTAEPGQREVRQADLVAVKVSALVEDLYAGFMFRLVEKGDHIAVRTPHEGTPHYLDALHTAQRARSGKATRTITPAMLERVAEIYREHVDDRPTQAVQRAYGVSPRMASEYVQRARRAGLLPPTTRGKKRA